MLAVACVVLLVADPVPVSWVGWLAAALAAAGLPRPSVLQGSGYAVDDVLDACAVAWSAARHTTGLARSMPDPPEVFSDGIPAGPRGGKRWSARYFVRRAAWHVLDHAWEIEDRSSASD